jgi:aspartate/methionine/tyrosine aminotransferase
MMVPAAMMGALSDDAHVEAQRELYARRRALPRAALEGARLRVDHSEAGLYLWATRDDPCWEPVDWLAGRGVLVAPGSHYGKAGQRYVRPALTLSDTFIEAIQSRLPSS